MIHIISSEDQELTHSLLVETVVSVISCYCKQRYAGVTAWQAELFTNSLVSKRTCHKTNCNGSIEE